MSMTVMATVMALLILKTSTKCMKGKRHGRTRRAALTRIWILSIATVTIKSVCRRLHTTELS